MRKKLSTKQRTENILKHVVRARSDDKLLCVLFMQKSGLKLSEQQIEKFFEMDDLWNVRRYRQKFQEQGLYPATPEVEANRFHRFKEVRYGINSPDPEKALEQRGIIVLPWGEGR